MRYLETFRGAPELGAVKKVALSFFETGKQQDIAYLDLSTDAVADSFEVLQGSNSEATLGSKKYIKIKTPTVESCESFFGFIPTSETIKKSQKTIPRIFIRFGGPERKSFYWFTQKETADYEKYIVTSLQTPERDFFEDMRDLEVENPKVPAMIESNRSLYSSMYPICFTKNELAEGFLSTTLQITFKRDMQAFLEPSAAFLDAFLRHTYQVAKSGDQDAQTVIGYFLQALAKKERLDDIADGFADAFVETLESEFIQARIKACIKYNVKPKADSGLQPKTFLLDVDADKIYDMMSPTKQHYSDLKNVLGDCFAKVLELQNKAFSEHFDSLWNVKKADRTLDTLEETEDVLELSQRRSEETKSELEKAKQDAAEVKERLKSMEQDFLSKVSKVQTRSFLGMQTGTATILLGLTSVALAGSTYHYYKKSKTEK